ncbi:MAG TPA: proline dehydrogenase family protein [Gemmatimonadales bacterium]|jgi:proline dehydrogenase
MMRSLLLWLSTRQSIFNFMRTNRLARKFASRFVAGETIADAVAAASDLHQRGITASLDMLGESVSQPAEAERARDTYIAILDAMRAAQIEVNVSVKLTQMGFDVDEPLCRRNVATILDHARELDGFVRLDMEGSPYTQRTLDFFNQNLVASYRANAGVVIQAALRRSATDIPDLIAAGVRVRLCKGAYLEKPEIAFPDKRDVDAQYIRLMEQLLTGGNYPGIATHDEKIIAHARDFVATSGIARDRFEFQMLYGVRRDLQEQLARDGYRIRVYIPFGTQWYPYLLRRLAERPANIVFILGNIAKERSGSRAPRVAGKGSSGT